jgi:hypothetical protein
LEKFLDKIQWKNDDDEMLVEMSLARLMELGLRKSIEVGSRNDAILILWAEKKIRELRDEKTCSEIREKNIIRTIEAVKREMEGIKACLKK